MWFLLTEEVVKPLHVSFFFSPLFRELTTPLQIASGDSTILVHRSLTTTNDAEKNDNQ
jgi:hypothetical protein